MGKKQTKSALAVLLISLAIVFGCEEKHEQQPKVVEPITIRIVHDPQTASVLTPLVNEFGNTHPRLSDGTEVRFELVDRPAILAAQEIADGRLKTDMWLSPLSSLTDWVNTNLQNLGPTQVECMALFATPMVFAARADHTTLFNDRDGAFSWEAFIRARFPKAGNWIADAKKIGMTHILPTRRGEGLAALSQILALATPERSSSGTYSPIDDSILGTIKEFEAIAAAYPEESTLPLSRLSSSQQTDIEFLLTSEQQLASFNASRKKKGLPVELRAYYPTEGSYWLDYRLCRSDADWVTAAHLTIARELVEYLRDTDRAQLSFRRAGFRPTTVQFEKEAPLTPEFGVNTALPEKSLPSMNGLEVAELLKDWPEVRRPEAIVFVLDASASMEGEAFDAAQRAYRRLIAELSRGDQAAIITFSTEPQILSDFTQDKFVLIQSMDKAQAIGGSAVYDAIKSAFDLFMDSKTVSNSRQKILVITDGDDKNSRHSDERLAQILERRPEQRNIRFVIFALTNEKPEHADLALIAKSVNGEFYTSKIAELEEAVQTRIAE
ncbi:MAG: VWA domain-containing protein [Bdellovibrionales bacterium]|nr:VWA domain-containing protein [Bdellovibrionales bacterium]